MTRYYFQLQLSNLAPCHKDTVLHVQTFRTIIDWPNYLRATQVITVAQFSKKYPFLMIERKMKMSWKYRQIITHKSHNSKQETRQEIRQRSEMITCLSIDEQQMTVSFCTNHIVQALISGLAINSNCPTFEKQVKRGARRGQGNKMDTAMLGRREHCETSGIKEAIPRKWIWRLRVTI